MARSGVAAAAVALGAGITVVASHDSPLAARSASADVFLDPFSSCDQVADWYAAQAMPQVTAWGLGQGSLRMVEDGFAAAGGPVTPTAGAPVGNGATGTNVQEAGVDEPDVAKTMDGVVVSIHRHRLLVTDVSGDEPVQVGTLDLTGGNWSYELLIIGDRAVVLGSMDGGYYGGPMPVDVATWGPWGGISRSSIATVDLSDQTAPEVLYREVVEGTLSTAREHDGTVRIVLTSPPNLEFIQPGKGVSQAEALGHNREVVQTTSAQEWLPQRGIDRTGRGGGPLLDCAQVAHPADESGLGTITVLTMDPEAPAAAASTAVSTDGSLVYASADRLYVATVQGGWGTWQSPGSDTADDWSHPSTSIHAFDTEGTTTTYRASGSVPGVAPDRWAFSEDGGYLRLATTLGPVWTPRETVVSVLQEQSDALKRVGAVGSLGKGESIQAARWFGDFAVLVTFRQTDPLYTLDLSDPTRPVVLDELKVTGFSEYLHPLGDDLLLGVGQAATRTGETTGAQLSTFTQTDPRLVSRVSLGSRTWSPVGGDSRTFTYLPELRTALVPTSGWDRGTTGLNVVKVAEDGSLQLTQTLYVPGWSADLRGLPLDDGRVAFVRDGTVDSILTLG